MDTTIITKQCTKCKQIKSLSEFYKDRYHKDGYRCACKICENPVRARYIHTEKGKEAHRQACRRYQLKKFGPRKTIDRSKNTKLILEGKLKSKQCSHCKLVKPLSEFGKCSSNLDGLEYQCTDCRKEYRQRPKSKALHKKRNKIYLKTEKGKAARKRHNQSMIGKQAAKRQRARAQKRYPMRFKARMTVGNAVIAGKIPHPTTLKCANCNNSAEQYHHHKGYAKEQWLNVIPVCLPCHKHVYH